MGSFRKLKIESSILRVISETIAYRLEDPRIEPLTTTITRVEVSRDKQQAMVYIHVRGTDAVQRRTLAALRHAGGLLQRAVAQALNMRYCPRLSFDEDLAAKRAQATNELLAQNRQNFPHLFDENNDTEDQPNGLSSEPMEPGENSEDPRI